MSQLSGKTRAEDGTDTIQWTGTGQGVHEPMSDDIDDWTQDIHAGDVRERLSELPANSVHMGMTSPPYFGLRDYGEDDQIGLEDSLDGYISELVSVFEDIRRVLRPDGSFWLNLGDSFEDKQKMLVPHRVAIALQDAGWVVRNDVTWVKPNPMPQSVTDRLNTTTEQVFHLTPESDYWYDLDAVREPYSEYTRRMSHRHESGVERGDRTPHAGIGDSSTTRSDHMHPAGKNPGDVFEVTTKPFPDAHFAVYPPELCEKPIKATCPPKVCVECGTPYERDVERTPGEYNYSDRSGEMRAETAQFQASGEQVSRPSAEFNGWNQPCDCNTDATESGIALDPFAGAGTTCKVAKDLGRRFVGLELNPEYVAMAQERLSLTVDDPEQIRDADATGLEQFTADEVSADD
jgi:DNA modification methylase